VKGILPRRFAPFKGRLDVGTVAVPVARREQNLVAELESDALNESVPLATALRKCIALGGRSGSEQLRDWATRELQGYHGEDDLPEYRVISAPLMVDGIAGNHQVSHQQIPPSTLPEFAREHISERLELRDGVGGLEALAKDDHIKLSPPMAADLTRIMNSESDRNQHIVSLYWSVSPAAMKGVLDQIRTALTQLIAEITAGMPAGQQIPSAAAADQAVEVVVTGKRNKVIVNTIQAAGQGATVDAEADPKEESGWWTTSRRLGAFIVGLAGVVAAVVAVIQLH
jgi:AbiTii